jgi:inosine-uridine nucleoside N-ribohydrolase
VVGDYGKPQYRARIIAKLLAVAGRTDVAVGLGAGAEGGPNERQSAWIEGYELARYPGTVHPDGVQAIIDTVMASPEPVTVICIGPLPNVAAALRREPRIAERARFVGMHGSVRIGYDGAASPAAEWNVRADPAACRACLTAPWAVTITPLDTCGLVRLSGTKYAAVRECADPLSQAMMANYRAWCQANGRPGDADSASSVLFDTVAVYLAFAQDLCVLEDLRLRVDDDGFTREDPQGKEMRVATAWRDLGAFEDLVVRRVTGRTEGEP